MLSVPSIKRVQVRLATEADRDIPAFDNTKLQAINVCPTWGIIRYGHHLRMPGAGRAMALEAGAAAHEVFAAVRLIELREHQNLPEHAEYHGVRMFGADRYAAILDWLKKPDDDRTRWLNAGLEALYTSGFHDDPRDKRRTMTNIEEACIAYMDRWPWGQHPVWVRAVGDPADDVGIENSFDMVLTFETTDGEVLEYRFIGKIDGMHEHPDHGVYIQENKTASRLDDAWRESFHMSSQVTGYCLAASLFTHRPIERARVIGMAIPQPKSYDFGGIVREDVQRPSYMTEDWFNWFLHTVSIYELYAGDVRNAPRYTHSCNRYFRPCAMIPYCASPPEDKEEFFDQMEYDEWSPLENETAGEQM